MNKILSTLYAWFARYPSMDNYASSTDTVEKAKNLVKYFYYFLFSLCVIEIPGVFDVIIKRQNFDPLPPIFWISFFDYETSVAVIAYFYFICLFIGILFYKSFLGRFIAFIGLLQFHSLVSSYVEMNHPLIPWLYTSFFFLFLPNLWKKDAPLDRRKFLLIIWGVQALFLLLYSMSGLAKVWGAYLNYSQGIPHGLAPESLALHVAYFFNVNQTTSAFGPFFIHNIYAGWPMYILGIYLEFFALYTVIKTSLQRLWAIGLICMHIGIYLTMNITFPPFLLLLMLFFFDSPFQQKKSLKEMLCDMPLVGWFLRLRLK